MTLLVGVPDSGMLARLHPLAPAGVELLVWRLGDDPIDRRFDLLVLPYMIPAGDLDRLRGQRATVVQAQMLGYDGVAAHLPPGHLYCNAVDVHEAATGELALALILASQRGIPEFVRAAGSGTFAHERYPGLALQRVVVLGAGGVGREVAHRLVPFDVELVRVARTARSDELGEVLAWSALREVLPTADIVVVTVPLDDSTRGLVDDDFLALLAPGALLVNVARGPVVDTEALTRAVVAGRVRAALDVTDPEPLPADHPLWSAPGALISPHVGGDVGSMSRRMDRLTLAQIERLAAGRDPLNVVLRS
ncbi:NAD(P)-dependent oxidoreductase [Galbitalea soli]|uniref:Hydroxyacid dehydrogenase n=1 Tax=Galbitalea soli TaxID=1268042 RepID=A0A7C9TR47_9MICO|nr:NAD(P)-dependent oxidoreductase [Galbitalea soli]NEM91024.1 hydroxyacid dehydrogenase [Galbitalea soli]NYJ29712.1 phosphoglycerate dehydrogenase-like enzyme [Galbitalea soli]